MDAIRHGRMYEGAALEKFASLTKKKVLKCGLFILPELPFLGASPDGIVAGEDALIEIKCPFKAKGESISPLNCDFLELRDGQMKLKKTNKYFYQVMGQMKIAKKKSCYFVVYSLKDMIIEQIEYEEDFFQDMMLPQLKEFYERFYVPCAAEKLII